MARKDGSVTNDNQTFARIDALFDTRLFTDVKVLIAGCGSGGSSVALHLVMSGLQNFTLLDKDVLEIENVIRHVCGRRYIGQKKVDAVEDILLDRNPKVKIRKIEADIMDYPDIEDVIIESDVVVLATDNEPSRYKINELCVKNKKSFVVARVFTRGIGGEAFAYRPGSGGCLACLEKVLARTTFREGIREIDLVSEEERQKIYGMEIEEIKDSPGLSLDISFITSFHARFVLDTITRTLSERPKYFIPIADNYIVWGNRPVHPFPRPFHLQRIDLAPQENCAVCAMESAANV